MTQLCAVVLAAGEGRRLRPITETMPKALCPVGNVTLLDRALDRLRAHGFAGPSAVAVNACYRAEQVVAHVGDRAHLSVEAGPPLGTAGGVANLRGWTTGRGVVVANADAYLAPRVPGPDLTALLAGWDGRTVRVLCVPAGNGRPAEFGGLRFAGVSLLPPDVVAQLPRVPANLVFEAWRPAERAGRLELIAYDGCYLDSGTPADFLAANRHAASAAPGGSLVAPDATVTGRVSGSVVGARARVLGAVTRSVVFPGGIVGPDEDLVDSIRVGTGVTVRAPAPG